MTKRIFVSYRADSSAADAEAFIQSLIDKGYEVDHSPNPAADDPRWDHWYENDEPQKGLVSATDNSGLTRAILDCDIFIAYINQYWDGVWMATEAERGLKFFKEGAVEACYYYNPENVEVPAMLGNYMNEELPKEFLV